jgi:hypothetical protein
MENFFDLKPSFLNSSEIFLEKYFDNDVNITRSNNDHEMFDNGHYGFNKLLSNLCSIKVLIEKDGKYILDISKSKINGMTLKQFIVYRYIKSFSPSWSQRFRQGLFYLKELETQDSIIFQCLSETGIFQNDISNESINFIYKVKSWIYSNQYNENNIQKGKLGEMLSFNYEYKKTGNKPIYESIINENSGYDLVSLYPDGTLKKIEVKTSEYERAFISWAEWQVAQEVTESKDIHEFHLWRPREENWQLAIITIDELDFIKKAAHPIHHWEKFVIYFKEFEELFNTINT